MTIDQAFVLAACETAVLKLDCKIEVMSLCFFFCALVLILEWWWCCCSCCYSCCATARAAGAVGASVAAAATAAARCVVVAAMVQYTGTWYVVLALVQDFSSLLLCVAKLWLKKRR